ncbi:MAG: efflux RND transporter periplasmic adaptor subunit [Pseudomonadota bacterium]
MTRLAQCLLVLPLILAACDDEETVAAPEPIRAIKHAILDQRAGQQERRIAGVVAASVSSTVAFETNGQVIELLRKAGDQVAEGDLIARLDPEPLQLQAAQSEAELARANAAAEDARRKFEQQARLRQEGFATQTAFDSAEAALKDAEGAVAASTSVLDRSKRNLAKADLRAPFAGVIVRREVEQFEEVTGGQVIYAMQTNDRGKIDAALPETLINSVSRGDGVEVSFPPLGDVRVPGTVDEIAPLTGDANAYPIEIALLQAPPGLRAGMSAELTFRFDSDATGEAFLVPLTAVHPKVGQQEAAMFVYQPDTKTVAERAVTIVNVAQNSLEVIGNLNEGDVIATAGVSFLYDGMRVDLFDPETLQ